MNKTCIGGKIKYETWHFILYILHRQFIGLYMRTCSAVTFVFFDYCKALSKTGQHFIRSWRAEYVWEETKSHLFFTFSTKESSAANVVYLHKSILCKWKLLCDWFQVTVKIGVAFVCERFRCYQVNLDLFVL